MRLFKATLILVVLVASFIAVSDLVLAQPCNANTPKEAIRCGTDDAANQSGGAPANTLNRTIARIVNIMSVLVGVAAVIMIIVGGFRYITSGGEANRVSGAKSTILYAIVGLVVVALSQIISRFVINLVD